MYIENLVATASLVCESQILRVYINLSITVGQPPNSPERDIIYIYIRTLAGGDPGGCYSLANW